MSNVGCMYVDLRLRVGTRGRSRPVGKDDTGSGDAILSGARAAPRRQALFLFGRHLGHRLYLRRTAFSQDPLSGARSSSTGVPCLTLPCLALLDIFFTSLAPAWFHFSKDIYYLLHEFQGFAIKIPP